MLRSKEMCNELNNKIDMCSKNVAEHEWCRDFLVTLRKINACLEASLSECIYLVH